MNDAVAPADRLGQKATSPRDTRALTSFRTHAPSVALFLVCCALAAGVFVVMRERNRQRARGEFDAEAIRVAASLRSQLELPLEIVAATAALFEASEDVSRAEFERFARPALARHPGIRALEWIPIVPSRDRAAVEAAARADGLSTFEFRRQQPDGSMVRAPDRDEHLPILYMEPPLDMVLGFDVASERDRREPTDQARARRRVVASERIRLIEDPPTIYSIAVFHPVFAMTGDVRGAVRGFATEVFRVPTVAERAIGDSERRGIQLALLDRSAPRGKQTLFESARGLATRAVRPGILSYRTTVPYAHRQYELVLTAGPRYRGERPEPPWFVLVAGGSLGWLLALVVSAARVIARLRGEVQTAQQLGQYTLLEKIGEGGMGAVYEARHAMLRRPTAIKILTTQDPVHLARFEREVQLTSQLTHPNTIAVYDYGRTPDGIFYYAMERIHGITLEELVRSEGPLPSSRVVRILIQACGALAEAHERGLVHRDVKPANLMLTNRGGIPDLVKVLDFGLVKSEAAPRSMTLSGTSAVIGTPLYMSPEAIAGREVDGRADLYALGAVAYFLVTGKTVFEGKGVVEVCAQHLHSPPVPPSERAGVKVPPELESLILRCLAKRPEDRPESARALLEELRALRSIVGLYSDEDARRFWEERGETLIDSLRAERRRRHAAPADGAATTLAVDLRRS